MRKRFGLTGLVSVLAMVGILLLASCSSTQSTPTSTSEKSAASAKPYGSLVIQGRPSGMDTMDPTVQGSPNNYEALSAAVFDPLVDISLEGQLRPAIAERYEISADGMTHTFYIRKGVKFHDGSDLTGADVKFSIERILSPNSTNIDSAIWRKEMASVELKDDYSVVLHLTGPRFELLQGFNYFGNSQVVVPKKYIEEKGDDYFRKNPVGSGPFKVVSFVPSVRTELEAVENHWREVPKFRAITVMLIPDDSTKAAMLKTGELDIAEVSPDQVASLKSAGLRIISHDGAAQYFHALYYDLKNPDKYAFGNIKVRKALSLATNRQEMADKILGGYAEPSVLFYVLPTAYFWDPNQLKADPYDPEGAKRLLAEAGYPNGFSTKIWNTEGAELGNTLNTALAGYWQKVGVNAELVQTTSAALRSMRVPVTKAEMYNTTFNTINGGSVFQFERMVTAYHTTKGTLLTHNNTAIDEIIDKVAATKDPAEKKKLALQAAVMARNEYSILAILDVRTVYALSSKVGEMPLTKGIVNGAYNFSSITHTK
ncbi:MAG: ABC transporter substrate-binding protein [Dehalococcoidia bacterium]|nr:ABC transporter substrate-binding protein [Dehalococcoidia bacterium]